MRHIQKTSHRHFIAVPLVTALVALTAVHGSLTLRSHLQASTLVNMQDASVHTVATDVQVILAGGSELDTAEHVPLLRVGSAIVQSEGIASMRIEDMVFTALNGAFHLTYYGKDVTVAALTTPVLVQYGDARVLLPVGQQWRSNFDPLPSLDGGSAAWFAARSTDPLPRSYLREQLQKLSYLQPLAHSDLPLSQEIPATIDVVSTVLLPVAQQEAVLGALRKRIEKGDADGVRAIMQSEDYKEIFSSQRGQDVLALLLARSNDSSALSEPLLQSLSDTSEDIWLLASVHPQYSTLAWMIEGQRRKEIELLAWFSLPVSDVSARAFSDLAVRRWRMSIAQRLDSLQEPERFLDTLLRQSVPSVQRMEEQHYPQRAHRFRQALLSLAEPYRDTLSQSAQHSLQLLEQPLVSIDKPVLDDAKSSEAQKSSAAMRRIGLPPEAVIEKAKELLASVGIIPSESVTIRALSPSIARIERLSAGEESQVYSFSFDIETRMVTSIEDQEKRYPNSVTLQQFAAWVQ